MAQQVEIAGVVYEDVPYIQCPDENGVMHEFIDTEIPSGAASASDIVLGKKAYVNGELVTGSMDLSDLLVTSYESVTVNRAVSSHASVTAKDIDGYSFVCWIDSNPSGWIASTYMENPTRQTTNVWVANNQTTTSGTGTVLCFSLYVKDL